MVLPLLPSELDIGSKTGNEICLVGDQELEFSFFLCRSIPLASFSASWSI